MTFWDSLCPSHGGLSHAVLHEAGHAVVAAHLGAEFVDVSVYLDPLGQQQEGEPLMGGGVRFATPEDFEAFVHADPVRSLQFCLAGAVTEKAAFGHWLAESYFSDLVMWRRAASVLQSPSDEAYEAILGRPFKDVLADTPAFLGPLSTAIRVAAQELGAAPNMTLTYERVRNLATTRTK